MLERIRTRSGWTGVAISIAVVAAFTLILLPFRPSLNSTEVALGFLLVVLAAATFFGSRSGLAASVVCILSFNFFFLPPYYTFNIAGIENWVAFGAFLITALVSGQLSGYALRQARESEQRRLEIERLYRELSEAFEQASEAEALRRSEKLKSSLLDAVTHDLRTPLTSIKAAVTTLLDDPDAREMKDEDRAELLEIVNEETDRLNDFIEKIVGIARLEAGEAVHPEKPGSVEEIIHNAVDRASRLLGPRRVEVVIPADLPPVAVNSISVSEAVFTVIDNAAKFSGPTAVIRITAARSGGDVTIDIEDQGQGLPAELGDRIFEKFVRAGSGADGRGAGLGLGLAFARGILETQHGSIRIGIPPEGFTTRFTITIPAVPNIGDPASKAEPV